jgi:hypothetical protein
MMRSIFSSVFLLSLLVTASIATGDLSRRAVQMEAIDDSNVFAQVHLMAAGKGMTRMHLVASGLVPGEEYAAVYYDAFTCGVHPREEGTTLLSLRWDKGNVIGKFTANGSGVGIMNVTVHDSMDNIRSLSVRNEHNRIPLACSDVPY